MMEPMGFGWLVMTLAGLLVPILLILHLGQRSAEREREERERRSAGGPDPREVEHGLAEGEIDREEYERLRAEPPER